MTLQRFTAGKTTVRIQHFRSDTLMHRQFGLANSIPIVIIAFLLLVGGAVAMSRLPPPDLYIVPTGEFAKEQIETLQQSEGVLAFPGAIGFGNKSIGGRGGRIVIVDTVDNIVDPDDGKMSLREAIEVEAGPRTIVFSVGGVFDAGDKELRMLGENASNVTVACQSAPAPGVIIRTQGFNIQYGAKEIIFRHCAVRLIDSGPPMSESGRSFTIRAGSENIILDHMSLSWATDEGFQVYLAPGADVPIRNITLSNSIIAEGDADSSHPLSIAHPGRGYHAMGPSCNDSNPDYALTNCSIVNNYIAHNSSRNAMIWGGSGELKNNVIYNWYGVGLTTQPHGGGGVQAIIDNNVMKAGPSTKTDDNFANPKCGLEAFRCALYLGPTDQQGVSLYWVGDNYFIDNNKSVDSATVIEHPNANTPDGYPEFAAATSSVDSVLDMAKKGSRFMTCTGASKPERDAVDARVIAEFFDDTGAVGIGENIRNDEHNTAQQRDWSIFGEPNFHSDDYDTDQDGMPDVWETENGLDPNNPNDHSADADGDGYTNIEEYLAIAGYC